MISNQTFMKIAYLVGQESYCKRRQVGAVIVKENNIIALGYNGTPSGFENCCEDEYEAVTGLTPEGALVENKLKTRPEVLHAESNAISKCARSTSSSEGADIYVTTAPCVECAKLIIQAGIKSVYYCEDYKTNDGIKLLNKAGLSVEKINQ